MRSETMIRQTTTKKSDCRSMPSALRLFLNGKGFHVCQLKIPRQDQRFELDINVKSKWNKDFIEIVQQKYQKQQAQLNQLIQINKYIQKVIISRNDRQLQPIQHQTQAKQSFKVQLYDASRLHGSIRWEKNGKVSIEHLGLAETGNPVQFKKKLKLSPLLRVLEQMKGQNFEKASKIDQSSVVYSTKKTLGRDSFFQRVKLLAIPSFYYQSQIYQSS